MPCELVTRIARCGVLVSVVHGRYVDIAVDAFADDLTMRPVDPLPTVVEELSIAAPSAELCVSSTANIT